MIKKGLKKKGLKNRSINDTTFLGGEGVKKPEKCMTKGGGGGSISRHL